MLTFTWRSETATRVSGVPSSRVVRSKKKFPDSAGWLPSVSWPPSTATRTYGPAGRLSVLSCPAISKVSVTAAGIVFSSIPMEPLESAIPDGRAKLDALASRLPAVPRRETRS